jgi:hypothetical protein
VLNYDCSTIVAVAVGGNQNAAPLSDDKDWRLETGLATGDWRLAEAGVEAKGLRWMDFVSCMGMDCGLIWILSASCAGGCGAVQCVNLFVACGLPVFPLAYTLSFVRITYLK